MLNSFLSVLLPIVRVLLQCPLLLLLLPLLPLPLLFNWTVLESVQTSTANHLDDQDAQKSSDQPTAIKVSTLISYFGCQALRRLVVPVSVPDVRLHCDISRERRAESRESRAGSRSRGSQSVDRGNNCSRETTANRIGREEVKTTATRMGREEVKRSVKELDVKSTRRRGVPLPKLETTSYPPSGVGLLWPNAKCVPEQLCAELQIWNFVNNGIHKVIYAISVRNCLLCYQSMPFSGRSLKYMSHMKYQQQCVWLGDSTICEAVLRFHPHPPPGWQVNCTVCPWKKYLPKIYGLG